MAVSILFSIIGCHLDPQGISLLRRAASDEAVAAGPTELVEWDAPEPSKKGVCIIWEFLQVRGTFFGAP